MKICISSYYLDLYWLNLIFVWYPYSLKKLVCVHVWFDNNPKATGHITRTKN